MIFFDDLIRQIRMGKWIQFYSDGHCYRFMASEKYLFAHESNPLKDDLLVTRLVLTNNRLRAINSSLHTEKDSIYSIPLLALENIDSLINPLSNGPRVLVGNESLLVLNPDFKLILKLIKRAKFFPSFIFQVCSYDSSLPLLELTQIEDKLNHSNIVLERISEVKVPISQTQQALFVAFRPNDGGEEHIAILIGEPLSNAAPLIRIHSECFTGDLFSSLRCDCGSQLKGAIDLMCQNKSGILIYLAQEGRGIGLVNKLRSYQLQDQGVDTVDANLELGFDEDERNYSVAAKILESLGVKSVKLLTNNPEKIKSLQQLGIHVVERVSHAFPSNPFNQAYLTTKKIKSGHMV